MVKLYVAEISKLPDPLSVPEVFKTLPLERQNRIHNMKQEKSRKHSMGVGLLLQKVLALYHMQDSQMFIDEYGKPRVDGVEFNLSHSGNLVVCAVSQEPVGCDVEEIRKAPKGVAERYLTDGEQAWLRQFSEGEYDREFFRLWTMKESYVKMTGEGLRVPFEAYEIAMKDTDARVIRDGKMEICYLRTIEFEGYMISICAKESVHAEVIWENLLFEV